MHFIYNVCIMYVCMVVSSVAAHKSPSQVDCCFRFIEFVHSLIIYIYFFLVLGSTLRAASSLKLS